MSNRQNQSRLGPFSAPVGQRGGRGAFRQRGASRADATDRATNAATMQESHQTLDAQVYTEEHELKYTKSLQDSPLSPVLTTTPAPPSPSPATASLEEKLLDAERTNISLVASLEDLQAAHVALEVRRANESAVSERSHVRLKARIRELEENDRQRRHENIRFQSLQKTEEEERRVAEERRARQEGERLGTAVQSAVHEERCRWAGEVERIRREAEALRAEMCGQELAQIQARERFQAAMGEVERGMALMGVVAKEGREM
jgi:hypothetical protein